MQRVDMPLTMALAKVKNTSTLYSIYIKWVGKSQKAFRPIKLSMDLLLINPPSTTQFIPGHLRISFNQVKFHST